MVHPRRAWLETRCFKRPSCGPPVGRLGGEGLACNTARLIRIAAAAMPNGRIEYQVQRPDSGYSPIRATLKGHRCTPLSGRLRQSSRMRSCPRSGHPRPLQTCPYACVAVAGGLLAGWLTFLRLAASVMSQATTTRTNSLCVSPSIGSDAKNATSAADIANANHAWILAMGTS